MNNEPISADLAATRSRESCGKPGIPFSMSEATIQRLRYAILVWASEISKGPRPDPLDIFKLDTIIRTFDAGRTAVIDEYQRIATEAINCSVNGRFLLPQVASADDTPQGPPK